MSVLAGWCLKTCCSLAEVTGFPGFKIPVRMFARRAKPLSVGDVRKKNPKSSDADAYFERVDPQVLKEVRRSEGELEPDPNAFAATYDEHKSEWRLMKQKAKQFKMVRKHFRPFVEKELNLLTYAEKEKIRFLHKSDPEQWNAKSLSRSFPISEEGVINLVKSSYRLNSLEQIRKHDEQIIVKLNMIKAGEIPLNDQLKAKLRIRNQIPIQPGLGTFSSDNFSPPKKPLGQFGKLVAMPQPRPKDKEANAQEFTFDHQTRTREPEPTFHASKPNAELRNLKINPNARMTLSEFEGEVKAGQEMPGANRTPEVDYLLQIKEKAVLGELIKGRKENENVPKPEMHEPHMEDWINFEKVPKYKNYVERENRVEMNVERGQPYMYDQETGYQKPFAPSNANDRVTIPANKKKPGSVYQIGDSYYDSDGEFLYRVI